jgi:hypothetical protein
MFSLFLSFSLVYVMWTVPSFLARLPAIQKSAACPWLLPFSFIVSNRGKNGNNRLALLSYLIS